MVLEFTNQESSWLPARAVGGLAEELLKVTIGAHERPTEFAAVPAEASCVLRFLELASSSEESTGVKVGARKGL